jgi:hypothetical protein
VSALHRTWLEKTLQAYVIDLETGMEEVGLSIALADQLVSELDVEVGEVHGAWHRTPSPLSKV